MTIVIVFWGYEIIEFWTVVCFIIARCLFSANVASHIPSIRRAILRYSLASAEFMAELWNFYRPSERNYHIITLKSTVPWMWRTYSSVTRALEYLYAIVCACARAATDCARITYVVFVNTHDECWMIPHIFITARMWLFNPVVFGSFLCFLCWSCELGRSSKIVLLCVLAVRCSQTMTYGRRCACMRATYVCG